MLVWVMNWVWGGEGLMPRLGRSWLSWGTAAGWGWVFVRGVCWLPSSWRSSWVNSWLLSTGVTLLVVTGLML